MEKEKTFHEFDMELISEYYSKLKRQGPGSSEMTIKALSFIDNLSESSKIADIGCGTGGQTMVSEIDEERMYHKYKDYYGYVFYIGKKFE